MLVFLAKLTGGQSDIQARDVLPGGHVESRDIYACLIGVANCHFELGVDDWVRMVTQ